MVDKKTFPTIKSFSSSLYAMKCYLYFIFFILSSGTSFGQDSLLIKKLNEQSHVRGLNLDSIQSSLKQQRDYALVFIDTVSVMEQAGQGRSGAENLEAVIEKHKAIAKDTIYLYVNEYKLSKTEIDSIWHAVFERARTQSLLKAYLGKERNDIFLHENYVNLISVFKAKQISSKTKQHLLVDKIRFDDGAIKKIKSVNSNNIPVPDGYYQSGPCRPMRPEPVYPYLINIPFQSKEQVISDYLEIIERSPGGNFAEANIVYVKARYRKKQLRLIRSKLSKEHPTSIKTVRRIKKLSIIDAVIYPARVSRALYSDNSGLLIIQYLK